MLAIKSADAPEVMDLVFLQYIERLHRLRATKHSISNVLRTATLLSVAGLMLAEAQEWELEEWLAGLPVAVRTKQLHLDNLRAAARYAIRRGTLQRDPTEYIRLPAVPDEEPRILSAGNLRAIRDRCYTDQQTLFFHLLAYTGMRRNELAELTWDDVTPESLTVRYGKGGKLRHVPVHPALGEVLVSVSARPGKPVLSASSGKVPSQSLMWYRLRKLVGGLDVTTHDFRRTVASSLYLNGVPTDTIDRILGWAPREVRSRYYVNIAGAQLQAAILKLYADDPL